MDFIKKGMVNTKYLSDGCEFKKNNNGFKLVSTANAKFQPFIGQTHSESIWDLISNSTITSGTEHNEFYSLLLNHFKSGHTIFKYDVDLLLKKGENVIYKSPRNIILREPKSVRVTNSVHAGTSHRHGKRSYGYGASKSVGESKEVIKQIDVGQIIITNKRFIFSGSKRGIDVNISQITGITTYTDGFVLQRKNKQKPEYFINIDNNAFTFNWNNETYFFFMNGQIVKSMIEGGLNKTPQVSKLQRLASQPNPQIAGNGKSLEFRHGSLILEYDSTWKKIKNEKVNRIFTIEKLSNNYRSEIHIFTQKIPKDMNSFNAEIENVMEDKGFKLLSHKNEKVNGIDMIVCDCVKDIDGSILEVIFSYFDDGTTQYCLFLSNNVVNQNIKEEYYGILHSIRFVDSKSTDDSDERANFCPNCGIHIEHDGNFCQNCGFKII